jgi:uncharacterized protein YbjT (DUF2867 family)
VKIAIAGASGFVGQMLLEALSPDYDCVALGRSVPAASASSGRREIVWRNCDLFSLLQTQEGLAGVDVAIYLVHSMLPRASLTQSSFEDCDLVLADNFARAAKAAGVQRVIYLGGLIPDVLELSDHLRSRREVEVALASQGASVTTLRAGLILGAQGSSFQMLYLLVKRLPVMLCPRWTRSLTQCIAATDVVELIRFCIAQPQTAGRTFDIGSPEVLTYRDLMRTLGRELGKKTPYYYVPFFTPGLSQLWVQLITGASPNLVGPLIQSLRHEMVVRDPALLQMYGKPLVGVQEALRRCLTKIRPTLRNATRQRVRQLRGNPEVRSIQRLVLPRGKTAAWVAEEYFQWLPAFLKPFVRVDRLDHDTWVFRFALLKWPLLVLWLCRERSTSDRQLFYIRGGLLVKKDQNPHSRLEFREVLGRQWVLAAIHEFRPALPWPLYKYTQALAHLWVMRGFRKHLLGRARTMALRSPGEDTGSGVPS